jgi:excisionase family DNA binding protein
MNTSPISQLGVTDAATFLSVSVHFIRRIVAERKIRYYKVGKYVRFTVADLTEFAMRNPVEPRKW